MVLLELAEVTVEYGAVVALDQVSLTVGAGTVVGLLGPNGAGKTTLLDVVTGLRPVDDGTVVFDGRDVIDDVPSRRARAGMARTFEQPRPFGSLTVLDNVLVAGEGQGLVRRPRMWNFPGRTVTMSHPRGNDRARAEELLERVGISRYADEPADRVTPGVARLLEVARALATEPRLLVLDEPSAGLDEAEAATLAALLRQLASQERAVLVAEHEPGQVTGACDTVHELALGRITEGAML